MSQGDSPPNSPPYSPLYSPLYFPNYSPIPNYSTTPYYYPNESQDTPSYIDYPNEPGDSPYSPHHSSTYSPHEGFRSLSLTSSSPHPHNSSFHSPSLLSSSSPFPPTPQSQHSTFTSSIPAPSSLPPLLYSLPKLPLDFDPIPQIPTDALMGGNSSYVFRSHIGNTRIGRPVYSAYRSMDGSDTRENVNMMPFNRSGPMYSKWKDLIRNTTSVSNHSLLITVNPQAVVCDSTVWLSFERYGYSVRHVFGDMTLFESANSIAQRNKMTRKSWKSKVELVENFEGGGGLLVKALKSALIVLEYLHGKEIIHGDINCGQLYYNIDERDFKFSYGVTSFVENNVSDCTDYKVHSNPTGPPELMYTDWKLTRESDIWDVGVLALELVHRTIPVSTRLDFERFMMNYLKSCHGHLREFVKLCLGIPGTRPSASELLRLPLFRS